MRKTPGPHFFRLRPSTGMIPCRAWLLVIFVVPRARSADAGTYAHRRSIPLGWTAANSSADCAPLEIVSAAEHHVGFDGSGRVELRVATASAHGCAHPVFRARFSGRALLVIDAHYSVATGMYSFEYELPTPGRYYLEILLLFCDYHLDRATRSCLFPMHCGAVNLQPYQVDWINAGERHGRTWPEAAWVFDGDHGLPLPTRYQGPPCLSRTERKAAKGLPSSQPLELSAARESHRRYAWLPLGAGTGHPLQWRAGSGGRRGAQLSGLREHTAEKVQAVSSRRTLCFVGDSHVERLFLTYRSFQPVQRAEFMSAKFPQNLGVRPGLRVRRMRCSEVIVHTGHWEASWFPALRGNEPSTAEQYASSMRAFLGDILERWSPLGSGRILLLSLSEMPLGCDVSLCPPQDFRVPPLFAAYNEALSRVVGEVPSGKVVFVDTRHIVTPLWDSAADWCHQDLSYVPVLSHVLGQILSHSPSAAPPLRQPVGPVVPVNRT